MHRLTDGQHGERAPPAAECQVGIQRPRESNHYPHGHHIDHYPGDLVAKPEAPNPRPLNPKIEPDLSIADCSLPQPTATTGNLPHPIYFRTRPSHRGGPGSFNQLRRICTNAFDPPVCILIQQTVLSATKSRCPQLSTFSAGSPTK